MFGYLKTKWLKAGVVRTLEQTGFNLQFARNIVTSLDTIDKNSWNLVSDCTKGLNNQCTNLFSSLITLEIYKTANWNNPDVIKVFPIINDILSQLNDAIDYQSNMGYEMEIKIAIGRKFSWIL